MHNVHCVERVSANSIIIPYKNLYIVTLIVFVLTKKIGTCDKVRERSDDNSRYNTDWKIGHTRRAQ